MDDLYFGKVDIVITARGQIIPSGQEKVIKSLEKGIVDNLMNYLQKKYKKVSINITPHIYTNRLYGHIKVER